MKKGISTGEMMAESKASVLGTSIALNQIVTWAFYEKQSDLQAVEQDTKHPADRINGASFGNGSG